MAPVSGPYRRPLLGLSRADTVAPVAPRAWRLGGPAQRRPRLRPGPGAARGAGAGGSSAPGWPRRWPAPRGCSATTPTPSTRSPRGAGRRRGRRRAAGRRTPRRAAAVRRQVLRRARWPQGPATELFAVHVEAVDALLTDWRGQAGVDLPGLARRAGRDACSARGLWQADVHGREARRRRPGQRPLHRGADPEPPRGAGRRDRAGLRGQGDHSSASSRARSW